MNGVTRACFGRVSVGLNEESGVIVLSQDFDGSTDVDQGSWDSMVGWLHQLGFVPDEDPILFTEAGVEVYRCTRSVSVVHMVIDGVLETRVHV